MQKNKVKKIISEHLSILKKDKNQIEKKVFELSKLIISCFENGGKILIFGNGGSAADAQHFSTELTVRLKSNRKALPALSLVTDTSAISAIGNDFGFSYIFKRQIEALAQKDDLIIPITTSGNSANIVEALKFSQKNKLKVFGIFGNNGGKCKKYSSNYFLVSSKNPSRIQEIHIIFWQSVCEIVEEFYASK